MFSRRRNNPQFGDIILLALTLCWAGCSYIIDADSLNAGSKDAGAQLDIRLIDSDQPHPDLSKPDQLVDLQIIDAGKKDVGIFDAGKKDVGIFDAGQKDVGIFDAGKKDVGIFDIGLKDSAVPDAPKLDVQQTQIDAAVQPDIAQPDAKIIDAAILDVSQPDVGLRDAGLQLGKMITINSGSNTLGSASNDPCRDSDEDQHQVTLSHSFAISNTEVTQGEFQARLSYNPSVRSSCGANCPVENVSWHEAVSYCNALSVANSLSACYTCSGTGTAVVCETASAYNNGTSTIYDCPGYRLPTEAEWEYAYRAGSTAYSAFYNGANDGNECYGTDPNAGLIGWYDMNSSSTIHPVGQKAPTSWGGYDLSGNVEEWIHDWLGPLGTTSLTDPWGPAIGTQKIFRGGSWTVTPRDLRGADRNGSAPENRVDFIGLRCVRTL